MDFYQSDLPMSAKQAATYYEAHASEPVARYHHLRKVMQPRLHRFFMDTFPEPTTWYENRMLFTRSWAVWAMVGHIVGLGDRHGENILRGFPTRLSSISLRLTIATCSGSLQWGSDSCRLRLPV